jgi:hypothetical protein
MQAIDIRDLERQLLARKRELGISGRLKPNAGGRRTASKRRLLRAIEESGPTAKASRTAK